MNGTPRPSPTPNRIGTLPTSPSRHVALVLAAQWAQIITRLQQMRNAGQLSAVVDLDGLRVVEPEPNGKNGGVAKSGDL